MTLPLIPLGLMGRTGTRNFPVLRSTSGDVPGTFATSHTLALPAGVQAGDLLVMFLTARATSSGLTDVDVSGWTELGTAPILPGGAAYERAPQAFYLIAPSAISTASVSTPGAATALTSNVYCYSEYSELPVIVWNNGVGANPEPPAVTVPAEWGGNPHCQFIAAMHLIGNVTASGTPGSYTDLISSVSSNNNRTYSVRRQLRATADDPSAYTITGTNPSLQPWAAATVAIRGT